MTQTGLFVHSTSRTASSKAMPASGHKSRLEPVPFSLASNVASKQQVRASASQDSLDPGLDRTVSDSIEEYCASQQDSLTLEKEALLQKTGTLEAEVAEMSRALEKKQQSVELVEESIRRDQEILDRSHGEVARLKEALYSGRIYLTNLEGKKGRLGQALQDLDEEDRRVHHELHEELAELRGRQKSLQERAAGLAAEQGEVLQRLQAKVEVFQLGDQQRSGR